MLDNLNSVPVQGLFGKKITGSGSVTPSTSGTASTPVSIVLPPGIWLVIVTVAIGYTGAPSVNLFEAGMSTTLNNINDFATTPICLATALAVNGATSPHGQAVGVYSVFSGTQTVFGGVALGYSGGTSVSANVAMTAVSVGMADG